LRAGQPESGLRSDEEGKKTGNGPNDGLKLLFLTKNRETQATIGIFCLKTAYWGL
jgi:hypothetical protein